MSYDSHDQNTRYGNVTPELDELSSTLMGDALDMIADGLELGVLVVTQDKKGATESVQLVDDAADKLLDAARQHVRAAKGAVRYAIAYEAGVQDEGGQYADALIVEFGERGCPSFSAYSLFEGRGTGDDFRWTDPAAAGEEEPLLG